MKNRIFVKSLSLVLCLLTFVPGIGLERNGAKRWIQFPLIGQFQPSELAKISIVFYLANLFDKKKDKLNSVYATILPATIGLLSFVSSSLSKSSKE